MLWYKAWLETRQRFLISLFGILVLCPWRIYAGDSLGSSIDWYYGVLRQANMWLCILWVLAVTLLVMGGLVREKAVGASDLTLAMPVSRERVMGVRIAVGLLQAMTLAVIPWAVMFLTAITTGKANSVFYAAFHLLLLAAGGVVFFGLAMLISSVVEGEYAAPAIALGLALAIVMILGDKPLSHYDPFTFMLGTEFSSPQNPLPTGPFPWLHLSANVLVAALLVSISIKAIQRRDF
jgi:ABC-2 type transport system permease protein